MPPGSLELTGHLRDDPRTVWPTSGSMPRPAGIYGAGRARWPRPIGAGGIKQTDPARYGSLVHPGDSFSYSIFEQAGKAVHTSGPVLLGGLVPKRVLAVGESQRPAWLVM